jgi:excisionase family DNA binding protein
MSTPDAPVPLLLRPVDAARLLSISPRTLWELTRRGEIRVVRVMRRGVRYSVVELQRWIDAQQEAGHE